MTETAGYSETPLLKKLGVKGEQRALLVNIPAEVTELNDYDEWKRVKHAENLRGAIGGPYDYIHFFCNDKRKLIRGLERLKGQMAEDAMIWVSWPKKASGVPSTVAEGDVRALAIKYGLVDIKVCAVDDVWSGLKLVIPVKDRKK